MPFLSLALNQAQKVIVDFYMWTLNLLQLTCGFHYHVCDHVCFSNCHNKRSSRCGGRSQVRFSNYFHVTTSLVEAILFPQSFSFPRKITFLLFLLFIFLARWFLSMLQFFELHKYHLNSFRKCMLWNYHNVVWMSIVIKVSDINLGNKAWS